MKTSSLITSLKRTLAVGATLMLPVTPAWAEKPVTPAAPVGQIGVIDTDRILQEAKALKEVRETIEVKRTLFQKAIEQKEVKVREAEKKFTDKQKTMTEAQFTQERKKMEAQVADLQKYAMDLNSRLQKGFEGAMGQVQAALNEVIVQVSKDKGLTMIIANKALAHFDPKTEVTTEVLALMDKKLPKASIKIDETGVLVAPQTPAAKKKAAA